MDFCIRVSIGKKKSRLQIFFIQLTIRNTEIGTFINKHIKKLHRITFIERLSNIKSIIKSLYNNYLTQNNNITNRLYNKFYKVKD